MDDRILRIALGVLVSLPLISFDAGAVRYRPLDQDRIALSRSIKSAYSARTTTEGLSYARRGPVPAAMRASNAAGETFALIFRAAGDTEWKKRRLVYEIVIDGRPVKKEAGMVDASVPVFHTAWLKAGPHTVRLSAGEPGAKARYTLYHGQVLVTGGERLSLVVPVCRRLSLCRATLREGRAILFDASPRIGR